jgi:hypothetical protein
MIYLGTITDRVPIIPPFAPDHHICQSLLFSFKNNFLILPSASSAGIIPFGDIFDLGHLRYVLRRPILEWRDVKKLPNHNPYSTSEIEDLGCWSSHAKKPIPAENVLHHLGLDVAYTRVPHETRLKPHDSEDHHVVFSQLAATIYPVRPLVSPQSLPRFAPSRLGHSLSPDDKLTCFDFLYYATSGVDVYEWRFSWSPAWQSIARHLKFTQPMLDLGQEYLRRVFLVDESHYELPPVSGRKICPRNQLLELMVLLINKFVAVHVRRGDFTFFCSTDRRPDCFPPLSVYKKHVDDIMTGIQLSHDIDPHALQVLVMSGNYIFVETYFCPHLSVTSISESVRRSIA